jgi:hypothetical protein
LTEPDRSNAGGLSVGGLAPAIKATGALPARRGMHQTIKRKNRMTDNKPRGYHDLTIHFC